MLIDCTESVFKVRWVGPSLGLIFGTIGDDNKFKLWREDPSQAPQSGRRFRCIFSQSPSTHVSYASFDFKTVRHELWMVIVSKDGLLSLLEPSEPGSLHAWRELDSTYPFGQHSRGSLEPTLRLSLHQAERPSYEAILAGLDPKAISLSLSAANSIKILRATRSEDGNFQLYQMLEILGMTTTINDVSWAPGSMRPCDLIAAACDDGSVRVYEVTTPYDRVPTSQHMGSDQRSLTRERRNSSKSARRAPSGIGAGLAGFSSAEVTHRSSGGVRIQHSWKETAVLSREGGSPAWRVRWIHDGCAIASTADSGKLRVWKQNLDGHFIEFSETMLRWRR
ncbi:MAG: hypothetical protein Q9166_001106 [cf. Caloplaca sp. 2 TL-2023]